MSTQQSEHSIPFSLATTQQPLRLLELPPSLLDVLTITTSSSTAPTLYIKSAGPRTTPPVSAAGISAARNAVLCAPRHTFSLRQVHTSNSVLVARPCGAAGPPQPAEEPGLRAVACCATTLELLPPHEGNEAQAEPEMYLRELLPVYEGPGAEADGDADMLDAETEAPGLRISKADAFADVPLSDEECEDGWRALCAFERGDAGAYRPAAGALLEAWKDILTASIAEGIEWGKQFRVGALWAVIEDENVPKGLFDGILRAITGGEFTWTWCAVEKDRCVPWVGKVLLEYRAPKSPGILTAKFLDEWKDYVPEEWRADVALELIKNKYTTPSSSTIMYQFQPMTKEKATAAATGVKPGAGARKWHEKFKKGRK
ncbi:sister chromatid cohesion protein Dcc1 [Lineolata rhizophorae]|uniref:Sister chromatid cohesion protein Dcc1 n=1 Tax=Lineolata rhizophorae TaxID=578093 RepID=A0A6A6P517_9PEZI|nr:sister chromatid cohesion protein Dcc1 [Lineolata rhizophorae]